MRRPRVALPVPAAVIPVPEPVAVPAPVAAPPATPEDAVVYDQAYNEAYQEGFNSGFSQGYEDGHKIAYKKSNLAKTAAGDPAAFFMQIGGERRHSPIYQAGG
ncbi:hypothetical protein HMSSN139_16330 [Paenibacillus sp. HMSSN-139]|nr:hypothetical protein HMSSN139_16330 [Paenibacillus sp. HMSSN-139]